MYKKIMKNQKGAAYVEMLLIVVIIIAITLIFKDWLISLVEEIFDTILELSGEL